MGPKGFPETSVNNYQSTPCNIPEGQRSQDRTFLLTSLCSARKRTLKSSNFTQKGKIIVVYGYLVMPFQLTKLELGFGNFVEENIREII
jgi:hypothetical protein